MPPKLRQGNPWLKWVAIAVLLPIMAWVAWYCYAKYELNARLGKLQEQDEPLNIKEWYAQAEANLPKERNPHADRILSFFYDLQPNDFTILQPKTEDVEVIFGSILVPPDKLLYGAWKEDIQGDVKTVLEKNVKILDMLQEIAAYPPVSQSEANLFKRSEYLSEYPIPHLLASRGWVNLLLIKSLNEARSGDLDASLTTIVTSLQMIQHYDTLPTCLINIAVDNTLRAQVYKSTAHLLNSFPMTPDQYERLAKILQTQRIPNWMLEGIKSDRMWGNDSFRLYHNLSYVAIPIFGKVKLPSSLYSDMLFRPFFDLEQAKYLDVMDDFLLTMMDYENAPWRSIKSIKEFDSKEKVKDTTLAKILMADLSSTPLHGLVLRSHYELLLTAVALKRFQAEHGAYPDNLKLLVPAYLETVPIDIYNGKSLRYMRLENGFLLWSIGENLSDDGGKINQEDACTFQSNEDIVLRME